MVAVAQLRIGVRGGGRWCFPRGDLDLDRRVGMVTRPRLTDVSRAGDGGRRHAPGRDRRRRARRGRGRRWPGPRPGSIRGARVVVDRRQDMGEGVRRTGSGRPGLQRRGDARRLPGGRSVGTRQLSRWDLVVGRWSRMAMRGSDPAFEGFGPYAAAGSDTVQVAVGLTNAGVDEESPNGLPGATFSRQMR